LYSPSGTKTVDKGSLVRPQKARIIFSHISTLLLATMMTHSHLIPFALFALFGTGLAQTVDGSKFNKPDGGPPGSYFAAGSSIPVAALQSAAAKARTPVPDATYPINGDKGAKKVTIHSDWAKFDKVDTLTGRLIARSACL
jgi:hypothetical protein